jgi:hypothetical protein
MNTFQLAEETWVNQGKDGEAKTNEDGTSQKRLMHWCCY